MCEEAAFGPNGGPPAPKRAEGSSASEPAAAIWAAGEGVGVQLHPRTSPLKPGAAIRSRSVARAMNSRKALAENCPRHVMNAPTFPVGVGPKLFVPVIKQFPRLAMGIAQLPNDRRGPAACFVFGNDFQQWNGDGWQRAMHQICDIVGDPRPIF